MPELAHRQKAHLYLSYIAHILNQGRCQIEEVLWVWREPSVLNSRDEILAIRYKEIVNVEGVDWVPLEINGY